MTRIAKIPGKAVRVDLEVEKGAYFTLNFRIKPDGVNPLDLTGYSARMQFRSSPGGDLFMDLTTGGGGITLNNPTTGWVNVKATDVQTNAIETPAGTYDFLLINPSAESEFVLRGEWEVIEPTTV